MILIINVKGLTMNLNKHTYKEIKSILNLIAINEDKLDNESELIFNTLSKVKKDSTYSYKELLTTRLNKNCNSLLFYADCIKQTNKRG
jgi:hypothetical protein